MTSFDENYIAFVGDKGTISAVLRTMHKNLATADGMRVARGFDPMELPPVDEKATLKALLESISEAYVCEPVYAFNPASEHICTSDCPDEPLLKRLQKGRYLLTFDITSSGILQDDLDAFTYALPEGRYAIASCHWFEGNDIIYANLGNEGEGESKGYWCGSDSRYECASDDPHLSERFCADDEGMYLSQEFRPLAEELEGAGETDQDIANREVVSGTVLYFDSMSDYD